MAEFVGLHQLRGNPLTLVGEEVKVGQQAPSFTVVDTGLQPVAMDSAQGKVLVLSVAPSIDTPVCATQLRRFNEAAAGLSEDVEIWNISRDLPFALKRFCGAEGIERVSALSDHKDREFGERYGLHIKELGLLARSVWVVDKNGVVTYKQIVSEMGSEPDYDAALEAVKAVL